MSILDLCLLESTCDSIKSDQCQAEPDEGDMMSAISGLGSSSFASQVGSVGGNRGGGHRRLETDLTNFLTAQGVSSDDQQAILSEIKDGISKASNGSRPDFSTVKDVVKSVLDSHGLSGEDFTSQIPIPPSRGGRGTQGGQFSLDAGSVQGLPPGPPPGPPPASFGGSDGDADDSISGATSSSSSSSSTQDTKESLIKKLLAILSQSQDSNSSKSGSQSSSASNVLSSIDVTV